MRWHLLFNGSGPNHGYFPKISVEELNVVVAIIMATVCRYTFICTTVETFSVTRCLNQAFFFVHFAKNSGRKKTQVFWKTQIFFQNSGSKNEKR